VELPDPALFDVYMEGIHGLPVPVRLKADLNFAARLLLDITGVPL
jgi:hypothetical protein